MPKKTKPKLREPELWGKLWASLRFSGQAFVTCWTYRVAMLLSPPKDSLSRSGVLVVQANGQSLYNDDMEAARPLFWRTARVWRYPKKFRDAAKKRGGKFLKERFRGIDKQDTVLNSRWTDFYALAAHLEKNFDFISLDRLG